LLAFSGGAIVTAPQAASLAAARGRRVLVLGALLLVVGVALVAVPAWQNSTGVELWTTLTGLGAAGAGLGLLVVPLVNVVLAAVPAKAAGGAAGTFTTAQQLGGAVGIAFIGALFFDQVTDDMLNHAFAAAALAAMAGYAAAGILAATLPSTAVDEHTVIEAG
jgi:MFS family permease